MSNLHELSNPKDLKKLKSFCKGTNKFAVAGTSCFQAYQLCNYHMHVSSFFFFFSPFSI